MKKKYYALLVDGKIEETPWGRDHIVYLSKRAVKKALPYWANSEKPHKLKIVEIRIGKEIKL